MSNELQTIEASSDAWERQEYETDAAFAGFQAFLLLPSPRTVADGWRKYAEQRGNLDPNGPVSSHYRQWSRSNQWLERAKAYDDHLWKLQLANREAAQRHVSEKLTQNADKLIDAAIKVAVEKGNATMLKDLLDRFAGTGVSRAGLESQQPTTSNKTNNTQINLDLSGANPAELIDIAKQLGPLLGSDE